MSRITGRVFDHSISITSHKPEPITPIFGGRCRIHDLMEAERRSIDIRLSVEVHSIPLNGADPVRQLMDEILADVNESLGNGNQRPGQALIQQLQEQVSNAQLEASKHKAEAERLQGIIDAFQQAQTGLLINSSGLRSARDLLQERKDAAKNRNS